MGDTIWDGFSDGGSTPPRSIKRALRERCSFFGAEGESNKEGADGSLRKVEGPGDLSPPTWPERRQEPPAGLPPVCTTLVTFS